MNRKSETQKSLQGTDRPSRMVVDNFEYLDKLPSPGVLGSTMSLVAKKIYRYFGKKLLKTGRLSDLDLGNLVQLACAWEKFLWAEGEMARMNSEELGTGFRQTYKTGATNVTTEFVIAEKSQDQILKLSKLFGLSMKDRHGMLGYFDDQDPDQLSLWDEIQEATNLKIVN